MSQENNIIIYDDEELIELIDINSNPNKINNLKVKFKEKLSFLEELYQKKYLEKKKKVDNQLHFKKKQLDKSELEYINTKKYYDKELDNIRFHEDLIQLNKDFSDLNNKKDNLIKKKNLLLQKRLLDNFYISCNKDIIEKNNNVLNDNLDYKRFNTNLDNDVKQINDDYEIKKKSLLIISNKYESSIIELKKNEKQDLQENLNKYNITKNRINNDIINLNNKIKQYEANKKTDNIKRLQNEKYIIDLQINEKKIKFLENKINENKKIKNEEFYEKIDSIRKKINLLNNQFDKIKYEKENRINAKIRRIENYKKYYKIITNDNNNLHKRNIILIDNIRYINKEIINIDLDYIKINSDIEDLNYDKNTKTEEICKKYKYRLNIYEDDLYDKKLKIIKIKKTLDYLQSRNVYDKDLDYVKKKIILYKKYLYD